MTASFSSPILDLNVWIEQPVSLPKTPTEKLFQNLGLLSEVSVLIPEEEISNQDPYAIDAKLDFLCGLRLLPTPLVRECPNATKKWLKATIESINVSNNTNSCTNGINSINDSEFLQSVNFGCILMDNLDEEQSSINNVSQNIVSIESPHNLVGMSLKKMNQPSPAKTAEVVDRTIGSVEQTRNVTSIIKDNETALSTQSTLLNVISIEFKELPQLVQQEIFDMEINQTTFAKASIGKTQGYLSDMLKKCCEFTETQSSQSSVLVRNLIKIGQFLSNPRNMRLNAYKKTHENFEAIPESNKQLKKAQARTYLSDGTKDSLINFYRQLNGYLSPSHFEYLAKIHGLTEKIVKVFFKNMKLRKKL